MYVAANTCDPKWRRARESNSVELSQTRHCFRDSWQPFTAALQIGETWSNRTASTLSSCHCFQDRCPPLGATFHWRMRRDSNSHVLSDESLANFCGYQFRHASINNLAGQDGFAPPLHRFGDEPTAVILLAYGAPTWTQTKLNRFADGCLVRFGIECVGTESRIRTLGILFVGQALYH